MNIVKSLNDYATDHQSRVLISALKEKLPTDVCYVPIKNKSFLKQYFSPVNNFIVHTTALACCEPLRVLQRKY